jgi:hypothetical protein
VRTTRSLHAVTVVAVVVFWMVSTSWRPWELFARAGFSADFYDEQARVLLRGRLAVDPDVPGPEGFLIDGRTYLYYGPFLALVRMPFQLFGDWFTARLVRVSMLVAVVVLCRWSARLARAAGSVVRGAHADDAWPIVIFTAAVAFSPTLFAAGWISVYNETELWAFTLALIAVAQIVEWAATGFADSRRLLGASAAALAATLTRAPIGLGVALAVGVSGVVLAWRSRGDRGRAGWCALVGGVVPLVAHAAVNWAKFGTLFSVPGGRQLLSLNDPARAAWFAGNNDSFFSARFFTTTVVQYFRPDAIRFERLVPGVGFGPVAKNRASYPLLGNTSSSSLTLTATLLMILAVVGAVWLVRHRARLWSLVVVCTALGALPTFMIGFLANRYLIDMLPPLVVAGAIGMWVLAAVEPQRWVRAGGVVLVVWGAWVNASLATWTLEQKSVGFTELRYRVDDWFFPAPSPGLVRLRPDAPVARDGLVGIDIDANGVCVGAYTAEQGVWVPIERGATRQRDGVIDASGRSQILATGDGWRVLYDPSADGIIVVDDLDLAVFEQTVDAPPGTAFDLVADPVSNEYYLRLPDGIIFLPADVLSGGSIEPSATNGDLNSSLCRRLAIRL